MKKTMLELKKESAAACKFRGHKMTNWGFTIKPGGTYHQWAYRRHTMQYLGTSHTGKYKLYLNGKDLYVYQFDLFGKCIGWLCSLSVWDRTLHKMLD